MVGENCDLKHLPMMNEIKNLRDEVTEIRQKQTAISESQIETRIKLDQVITTLSVLVLDVKAFTATPASNWNGMIADLIKLAIIGALSFAAGKFIN